MTITTSAADTAAMASDDTTSKRPRRVKTVQAGVDPALVNQLVRPGPEQGLQVSGEGGLLQQLTKIVLESALDGGDHRPSRLRQAQLGRANSGNSRRRTPGQHRADRRRPVELSAPRDRAGSFEPTIVRKLQRRLSGVEDMVLSLSAKR